MEPSLAVQAAALPREWRTCLCGCKRKFKVAVTSPQVYASKPCAGESGYCWVPTDSKVSRSKKGTGRVQASVERQKKNELPEGMVSAVELAARLGVQAKDIYNAMSAGKLTPDRFGPRKTAFNFEKAKAEWELFRANVRKKKPVTHGMQRLTERSDSPYHPSDPVGGHAGAFAPNTTADGRKPSPMEMTNVSVAEVIRHHAGPKYPEPIIGQPPKFQGRKSTMLFIDDPLARQETAELFLAGVFERMPAETDEQYLKRVEALRRKDQAKDPTVHQAACELAKPFVDRARLLEAQGKFAGAREFLWYAVETMGFKGKANQ